jgi:four helix bundle protein
MRNYRNTDAYRLARALVVRVYGATGESAREAPGPVAALRRAAIGAAAPLVEGSTLPGARDHLRCLSMAREALAEFPRQVNLCQLRGHLTPQDARLLLAEQAAASAALGSLIAETESLAS